jgi:NAD(P)H dehydrogenase (quinone)
MKHIIVVAHPNPKSLNAEIAQAYAAAAGELGQETLIRNLYCSRFDPCLKSEETPGRSGYTMHPDVLGERELLAAAEVFALVYPLWFNAPPAMMKGYVDRVFSMGFGYEPGGDGGNTSLLDGKKLISFTTSGAPDAWVKDTGALEHLIQGFDRHLAAVCGMTCIDHINFGGITPGITKAAVDEILRQVRATVRRAFAPADLVS